METHEPLSPAELAHEHDAAIRAAVERELGIAAGELTVLPDASFVSETGDGSVSFFVRHATGVYGVNAIADSDGGLTNITVANLQHPDYRQAE